MAVDNRPFKSKEQDGQGNEVIIRDQQLVEQGTTTTMPAGACFQTLDVDGRPVKIPKDNMLNLIVEGLGIIFSGQSDQQTVTKVPTLNGNNFGASTVATLASVLGAQLPVQSDTVTQDGLTFVAKKVGKVVTITIEGTVGSGVSASDYIDVYFNIGIASPFGRIQFQMQHGILTTRDSNAICLYGIKTGDSFTSSPAEGNPHQFTFITSN